MTYRFIKSSLISFFSLLITIFILFQPVKSFCADEEAPVSTGFSIEGGDVYANSRSVSITLSGNDPGGGVTGYYLSEDSTAMSGVTTPTFTSVSSTQIYSATVSFTLSEGEGSKTVYVWYKDAAGNISSPASDSIILDISIPASAQVQVNDGSGSISTSQVEITISATDNYGIIGYRVSENSETPESMDYFNILDAPVVSLNKSYTFNLTYSGGTKTLYAWFIDEAGNISSPVSTVVDFSYGWFRFYDLGEDDVLASIYGNYAAEIAMDDAGNIYAVGKTVGDIGENENKTLYGSAFVTKMNSAGDVIWCKLLETTDSRSEGTVYSSKGEHIAVDSEGNVYIAGIYDFLDLNINPDAFVAKFDSDGNQQYLKTYGLDGYDDIIKIRDIAVGGSDYIYIYGYTSESTQLSDTVTINNDYYNGAGKFLAKYSSSGTLVWGVSSNELVGQGCMVVDDSGNIFVSGVNTVEDNDLHISKFSSGGVNLWTTSWGDAEYYEYSEDMTLDSLGNIYITGFRFPTDSNVSSGRAFVGKFNPDGNPEAGGQWTEILDLLDSSDYNMGGEAIAVDSKDNIYITGYVGFEYNQIGDTYYHSDMFMRKYSSTGTELWTKRVGNGGIEYEDAQDIVIGQGDVIYTLAEFVNYSQPGVAGQEYSYNSSLETCIWKSGSDSLLDLTLPTGTFTINSGDSEVMGNVVTLNLSASDNTGVTGYYISETDMLPDPGDFTMIDETPDYSSDVQYTFETVTEETKKVYVWFRDASGNYSNPRATASIDMTGDTVAPVGEVPVIDEGAAESQSPQVSIELSASDNVAVVGYFLTDAVYSPSAEDFTIIDTPAASFSATVSYTLEDTTPGPFFIYAYFLDAAGNISAYARGEGDLADTTPPVTTIDPAPGYYDDTPITVTLSATDDYYLLFTYYSVNGGAVQLYSEPFEVTPPARIGFLSRDLDDNYEELRYVSYILKDTHTGTAAAGNTASVEIEATEGSTLKISFSLDSSSSTTSIMAIGILADTETVVLKQPGGTVYDTYSYSGGTMDITVEDAAAGTWTLDIDNSEGTGELDYSVGVQEVPPGGSMIEASIIETGTSWNLVSLYKEPSDTTTETVLTSIADKYISVWAYDGSKWEVYDPNSPLFSDLTDMVSGRGYWINMSSEGELEVTGDDPSKTIELAEGWNLVGYNSSSSQAVADAVTSIEDNLASVWAYKDGQWQVYDPASPLFSDLSTLEPGYGYWIKTSQACTWTLP